MGTKVEQTVYGRRQQTLTCDVRHNQQENA